MNTHTSISPVPSNIPVELSHIFGKRPLIRGEKPEDYDDFISRIAGSVRPNDFMDWTYVKDIGDITWEIRRNRWLGANIVNTARKAALRHILRNMLGVATTDEAAIADKLISNDPATIKEFEPQMKKHEIDDDFIMAKAFEKKLETLETIDRIIERAESRRDKLLETIEYRREAFARALRKAAEVEGQKPHADSVPVGHHGTGNGNDGSA